MIRVIYLSFLLCALLGFSGGAYGDEIVIKNGDLLTGVLTTMSDNELSLETDYAGRIVISVDQIRSIKTQENYEILIRNETLRGRLFYDLTGQYVLAADGHVPILLEDVSRIEKKQNLSGAIFRSWRSRADLSLILSQGNSETKNYNVFFESILKRRRSEHALALLINNEKAEAILTREQFDLDYGYKRFISRKWFASGTAEYFEDELKDIERRITMSGGAGYQFWDNVKGELSVDLSVSAVQEKIGLEGEINPALRLGIDYRRMLFLDKMELFHRQSVLAIPDAERGQVINASSGIRYELSTFVDTAFRIDTNYETKPAPGREKTDLTYTIGLGLKF